jgi:SH3-like domain-containing protein
MSGAAGKRRRWLPALVGLGSMGLSLFAGWMVFANRPDNAAAALDPSEITGSAGEAARVLGTSSGLPLPRFVSLKSGKTNVRRGPSDSHRVDWVFQRKGLPVEIVAESDNWRRIRDSEGEEGWILQNLLTGKRTALIMPWDRQAVAGLYAGTNSRSGLVAKIEAGVLGEIESCAGGWCEITAGGKQGYIEQSKLWGVYPGETVDD